MPRRCMDDASAAGGPGFVVARGTSATASFVVVTWRPIAGRRAGGVRQVRFFPWSARPLHQRRVRGVVQPGVPLRGNLRRIGGTGIGDPAPYPVAGARPPLLVIDVAGTVLADTSSLEPGEQPGTEIHAVGIRSSGSPVHLPDKAVRSQTGIPGNRLRSPEACTQ